jgi:hypothetical protein
MKPVENAGDPDARIHTRKPVTRFVSLFAAIDARRRPVVEHDRCREIRRGIGILKSEVDRELIHRR